MIFVIFRCIASGWSVSNSFKLKAIEAKLVSRKSVDRRGQDLELLQILATYCGLDFCKTLAATAPGLWCGEQCKLGRVLCPLLNWFAPQHIKNAFQFVRSKLLQILFLLVTLKICHTEEGVFFGNISYEQSDMSLTWSWDDWWELSQFWQCQNLGSTCYWKCSLKMTNIIHIKHLKLHVCSTIKPQNVFIC